MIERLSAVQIVVGANFRFGHRASGDVALLRKYDLAVDDVPLLRDGEVVSSTLIRDRVAARRRRGRGRGARPAHLVEGPVVRGDARGRELGFPTANLAVDDGHRDPARRRVRRLADPRRRRAHQGGDQRRHQPDFDGEARRVEAYVIDEGHDLELYDEHVVVEFAAAAARDGALRRTSSAPGRDRWPTRRRRHAHDLLD